MCSREEGLICVEHDRVLQALRIRMEAVLGDWSQPKFMWCPRMVTERNEVHAEAKNLFGNDGPVTQVWDGSF